MQILGEWFPCDDGVIRPVVRGEIQTAHGDWLYTPFLIDTGADCTAFDSFTHLALGLPPMPENIRLGGVGGTVRMVVVSTAVRHTDDTGTKVLFRGHYAAATDPEALDMSVLGRDITDLFAIIVDRPGNVVCLVGQRHSYRIERR